MFPAPLSGPNFHLNLFGRGRERCPREHNHWSMFTRTVRFYRGKPEPHLDDVRRLGWHGTAVLRGGAGQWIQLLQLRLLLCCREPPASLWGWTSHGGENKTQKKVSELFFNTQRASVERTVTHSFTTSVFCRAEAQEWLRSYRCDGSERGQLIWLAGSNDSPMVAQWLAYSLDITMLKLSTARINKAKMKTIDLWRDFADQI